MFVSAAFVVQQHIIRWLGFDSILQQFFRLVLLVTFLNRSGSLWYINC